LLKQQPAQEENLGGDGKPHLATIGAFACTSGVKSTTIRYCGSIGLIDPPDRSEGGQRLYDQEAVKRRSSRSAGSR
jgi:hypothetical protein